MEEEYEVRTLDELYGHLERLREEKGVRWLDIAIRMDVSASNVGSMVKTCRDSHFCTVCRLADALGYRFEFSHSGEPCVIDGCIGFADMLRRDLSKHIASDIFENGRVLNYVYDSITKKEVKTRVGTVLHISEKLGYSVKIKKNEQE